MLDARERVALALWLGKLKPNTKTIILGSTRYVMTMKQYFEPLLLLKFEEL